MSDSIFLGPPSLSFIRSEFFRGLDGQRYFANVKIYKTAVILGE